MERTLLLFCLSAVLFAVMTVEGIPVESSPEESGDGAGQSQSLDKNPAIEFKSVVQSEASNAQSASSDVLMATEDKVLFPPLVAFPILTYTAPRPTTSTTTRRPPPPPIIYIPPPGQASVNLQSSGQSFNIIQAPPFSQG